MKDVILGDQLKALVNEFLESFTEDENLGTYFLDKNQHLCYPFLQYTRYLTPVMQ